MLFPCLHEQMVFRVYQGVCNPNERGQAMQLVQRPTFVVSDAYAIFLCLLRRNDNLRPHDFRGIVFHLSRAILPVNRSRSKSARCFAEIPTPVTIRRADVSLFLSWFSFVTNQKRVLYYSIKLVSINCNT